MGSMEVYLDQAGFTQIAVELKEESRQVIAQWMPGSGAEDFVVSANITAIRPTTARKPAPLEDGDDSENDEKPTIDDVEEEDARKEAACQPEAASSGG